MNSLFRTSLGLLVASLILTLVIGSIYGFSYANGTLSPFGFTLVFFFALLLPFLVIFGLDLFFTSLRLEWNEWIVDVKEMDWLFNDMYWIWLIYHNHKKWAKWKIIIDAAITDLFVTIFAIVLEYSPKLPIGPESFWTGWIIANIIMTLFATAFYLKYISVDRTPSPYPKGRLENVQNRI